MYHYVRGKGWVYGPVVPDYVLYSDGIYALIYVKDVPDDCKRSSCGTRRANLSVEDELEDRAPTISDGFYVGPRFNTNDAVCAVYLKDLC